MKTEGFESGVSINSSQETVLSARFLLLLSMDTITRGVLTVFSVFTPLDRGHCPNLLHPGGKNLENHADERIYVKEVKGVDAKMKK
jgi:hypothetical protein